MRSFNRIMSLTLAIILAITMFGSEISKANETPVNLGTADSFALLAGSTITNTGTTIINGDVGLHPGTVFTGQDTAEINGEVHLADAVALQAKDDLLTAYNNAAGRAGDTIGAELGGKTLTPGVYSTDTSFQITGTLTFDGQNDPNAVFILQAGSTLTTASYSNIELINGANSNNIFWQVGSSATLGTYSEFVGNILSSESITVTTGANIQGQLLALNGAITLDNNTITNEIPGSLTVTKVVTGDIGDMTLPEFEITVTGPEDFLETKTFVHNESFTWENLVPGEYTVTEDKTGLSSDVWAVSGEGAVQVEANQQQEATIINAYSATDDSTPIEPTFGSLTVTKVVTGDIGDMTLPTFELTVTGPDNFSETRIFVKDVPYTWVNLVPGEYTVTENQTGLNNKWTFSGDRTIQVEANQEHEATVTNTYSSTDDSTPIEPTPTFGSLTVTKVVTGDIGDMSLPTFELTVTGPDNFSETRTFVKDVPYTFENLAPGEYNVIENRTGLSSEWTVDGEGSIQVEANNQHAVTVTNIYSSTDETPLDSTPVTDDDVTGNSGDNDEITSPPELELTVTEPEDSSTTETVTNNDENGEEIPQTGQNTDYSLGILLGIIAAMFASVGIILANKRKKLNA